MLGGMEHQAALPWTDNLRGAQWAMEALRSPQTSMRTVPRAFTSYARLSRPAEVDGYLTMGRTLIALLRRLAPGLGLDLDRCWFAVADLYGWNGYQPQPGTALVRTGEQDATAFSAGKQAWLQAMTERVRGAPRPPPPEPYPHPLAHSDIRSYMIFPGRLEDAVSLREVGAPTEVPDLWWPEDRAWFVGGDTDLTELYLGGPDPLIDEVLADPNLISDRVDPAQPWP